MNHTVYSSENSVYLENDSSALSQTPNLVIFPPKKRYVYPFIKRFFDIILSAVSIPLLSPLLFTIALFVKISSPGEIIFKQTRMGQYGKTFTLYKFRTMTMDAPPEMATSKFNNANQYISKIGKYLRRTSLDELPQLFNILIGNMALIGPRPLILAEKEIHDLRLSRGVYNLKPGITGLAQISGRDLVKPDEKVGYDEKYLYSFSFITDLKIFFKTVYIVFTHKGIADGNELDDSLECEASNLRFY